MGLDMYLRKSRYLSEYNDKDKKIKEQLKTLGLGELNVIGGSVCEWGKANQIHNWIMDGREDECQTVDITRDQLEELVGLCKEVLGDHSQAEALLPTSDGFFFGSQDYDEWYFSDLQDTVDDLEKELNATKDNPNQWDYEYQASW